MLPAKILFLVYVSIHNVETLKSLTIISGGSSPGFDLRADVDFVNAGRGGGQPGIISVKFGKTNHRAAAVRMGARPNPPGSASDNRYVPWSLWPRGYASDSGISGPWF